GGGGGGRDGRERGGRHRLPLAAHRPNERLRTPGSWSVDLRLTGCVGRLSRAVCLEETAQESRPTDKRRLAHHSNQRHCKGEHPMLTISTARSHRLCDGVSRRDFLRIGSLGVGGLTLPWLLQLQA